MPGRWRTAPEAGGWETVRRWQLDGVVSRCEPSSSDGEGLLPVSAATGVATALHVVGYPVAVVVIARFVPVVRDRRVRWFVAHQLAVTAIVAGWLLRSRPGAAAVNAAWLGAAAIWYGSAARGRR